MFTQGNRSLSKKHKGWWHCPSLQLSTVGALTQLVQPGTWGFHLPQLSVWGHRISPGGTGHQHFLSPHQVHVVEVLPKARIAERSRTTFHHPQIMGQKICPRHSRLTIWNPNPLDPSSLMGRFRVRRGKLRSPQATPPCSTLLSKQGCHSEKETMSLSQALQQLTIDFAQ